MKGAEKFWNPADVARTSKATLSRKCPPLSKNAQPYFSARKAPASRISERFRTSLPARVFRSAWMPAPQLLSEPAIVSTAGRRRDAGRSLGKVMVTAGIFGSDCLEDHGRHQASPVCRTLFSAAQGPEQINCSAFVAAAACEN